MITNLIASIVISLATNTTEYVTKWESMRPCANQPNFQTFTNGLIFQNAIGCTEGVGPLEKTVITTVTERTALKFRWAGRDREVVEERAIRTDARILKLQSNWVTNNLPPQNITGMLDIRSSLVTTGMMIISEFTTNAWSFKTNTPLFINSSGVLTNDDYRYIAHTPANPDRSEGPLNQLFE